MVLVGQVAAHAGVPHVDAPHVQHPPYVAGVPYVGAPCLQLEDVHAGVGVELEAVVNVAGQVATNAEFEDVSRQQRAYALSVEVSER